jgi:dienelactone hydrolase
MLRWLPLALAVWVLGSGWGQAKEKAQPEKGTVPFRVVGDQKNIPERYRLDNHTFPYEMHWLSHLPNTDVDVYHLQYPSAFTSPHPENNTVHAEYYRPPGKGPFPGVIVLDITGGDQSLSRLIATQLAQNQIAGLFVQMAYYGPRRPPGSKLRLMSPDIGHTLQAVRQTVLDLRRAAAWLESRSEIDAKRLGILGTSLGSFMSALAGEMEPRLGRVVVLLGGGGLVDAYYDHPQGAALRKVFEALGGNKKILADLIAPADPLTCAANLRDRQLLIIAGKRDEIVPPSAAVALWKASGEQKIIWYDCGHYTAAFYFVPAMHHIIRHLKGE